MNSHAINGASINGSGGATTVQTTVSLVARAVVSGVYSIKRRITGVPQASAVVLGGGRIRSREPVFLVQARARAATVGKVMRRGLAPATSTASTSMLGRVRARITGVYQGFAQTAINPRRTVTMTRQAAQASAVATLIAIRRVASPANVQAWAMTAFSGVGAKGLTTVRSVMPAVAVSSITIATTIYTRPRAAVVAQARAVALPRVLMRSPVAVTATAFTDVDASAFKRLPFDEPAPEERVFRVPSAANVFFVRS